LADERTSQSGLRQRIARLPLAVRLLLLAALVAVGVWASKWLMLIFLVALGLWPITLALGLVILAVVSIWHGGWPWMKEWLSTRLRGLVIPALSVLTALIIGGLVLFFTDQQVYEALREGGLFEAIKVGVGNLLKAYGALYEGAFGNPADILKAIPVTIGGEEGLTPLLKVVRGPSDSLVQSVPYIFAGLAVALGFRAGLFNIGAE
jgi:hypothetical protein